MSNKQGSNDEFDNLPYLLEQYKLYVEMMDRVAARRGKANQFYLSLISALLGILTFFTDIEKIISNYKILSLLFLLFGLILCISWYLNIDSYKQLNYLKFKVIFEMEQKLPFPCYTREWEIEEHLSIKYRRLTKIEKYIPIFFASIYIVLIGYSILSLLKII
ncbi:hypothetical protein [Crocosphaera sp.]|uniref:RipA family octameric membrane protein n=1 Tax=Crocosphaera sp. TaxID=2729996 RepID=UPI002632D80F|nr:hypothetical protein [Crocosphaera sp.]MDJ0580114.1 hypothetical protein [Crocosphaera sp.]